VSLSDFALKRLILSIHATFEIGNWKLEIAVNIFEYIYELNYVKWLLTDIVLSSHSNISTFVTLSYAKMSRILKSFLIILLYPFV